MSELRTRWNVSDLRNQLHEFFLLYNSRPILDNEGGMKSGHMFPSWFVIKQLKPAYIIESGVWKGLGTWFFEQASPQSTIISIEPSPQHIVYRSPAVTYQCEDFTKKDWSHLPKDDTFLFFDDHQNALERIKYAQQCGFKKMMFEDNYPYQHGDCYSPKKILSNKDYCIDKAGQRTWYRKNNADYHYLMNTVKIYQEMNPIFKGDFTRWGDAWNETNYPTPEPLLPLSEKDKYPLFFNELRDYTWICYVEL